MSLAALETPERNATPTLVTLPEHLTVDEVKALLLVKFPPPALAGRAVRLDLGARELELFEIRRLLAIFQDDHEADVVGLLAKPEAISAFAGRQLKVPVCLRDEGDDVPPEHVTEVEETLKEAPPPPFFPDTDNPDADFLPRNPPSPVPALTRAEPSGRRTLSLHRTLRSGAVVRFDGDVLIFGDVNPGAQVVAAGNVTIMGSLKGMAHAGATGAEDCFIFAFELIPTQLRVGRKIAVTPQGAARREEPEFARLVDGQILIEPYRARRAAARGERDV